jgi:hypothetical protein
VKELVPRSTARVVAPVVAALTVMIAAPAPVRDASTVVPL